MPLYSRKKYEQNAAVFSTAAFPINSYIIFSKAPAANSKVFAAGVNANSYSSFTAAPASAKGPGIGTSGRLFPK